MTDQRIRDLLHDVADGLEPGDRLGAIRAATGRRTHRGWWAAGGVALVAASVVTAMALTTGGTPQTRKPDPAAPPPTSATDPTRVNTEPPSAIFYVGDTPSGPRLYSEQRDITGDVLANAVAAAVGRDADGRPFPPLDPDYRVPWPALTSATARLDTTADEIVVSLAGDPEGGLSDRGALTEAEARLAVEQVVRTAQGVVERPLPVRFELFGQPAEQVLGIPVAAAPVTAGSDLSVLSHVSLTTPDEGQEVDNDEPFTVTGLGNSFEGNIVTRIQRWEGTYVVDELPAISGTYEDKLFPWTVTFDLTEVPPGDYVVISRTDDPSGAGMFDTDTRRITVVD